jgi:calcineurin-like phosphoesterase family protein
VALVSNESEAAAQDVRAAVAADLAREIVVDLVRSVWVIEHARASVYRAWSEADSRWAASEARTLERAGLVEGALRELGRAPDERFVEPHAEWIRSLIGDAPDAVPLGPFFLARLGDWIDAHAAGSIGTERARFLAISEEERGLLELPSELPTPPPFEPFEVPEVEAPGPVRFRFAILGDLHVGSRTGDDFVAAAIADVNSSGAELVVQLGDITDHGEKAEFQKAADLLARLEMPVITIMGNHDVTALSENRLSGREYYTSYFGRPPDGVLIEHKGVRFAALDSVEHAISPFPAFDLVSGSFLEGPGGAIVRGALSVPQHEILADVAAPGSGPAFVFLHHPPQPFTAFPPILFGLRDADSGRLHATADSGNVWGVFAGHTHRNARTREYGSVPVHEVGIPRDYPHGYALVDVTDEGYAYRFVQVSDEKLLRAASRKASAIHRRYAAGDPAERAFTWRASAP